MAYTHDDYLNDRKTVMQHYNGDAAQYDAAQQKAFGNSLKWSDVEAYAAIYPEQEQKAKEEIIRLLGYLPHPNIIIPHEVFIRTLIDRRRKGLVSAASYNQELKLHVMHIRNDDMRKFCWADKLEYSDAEIAHYDQYFHQFKEQAQTKIIQFFGVLPALAYRLPAELLLRKAQYSANVSDGRFTASDYRAFTIIAYRKACIDHGLLVADRSRLIL